MNRHLGNEIRSLRYSLSMTLEELAQRSGLSIGYLSQIERDLKRPSSSALERISEAFGTSVEWFLHIPPVDDPVEAMHVVRRDARRRMQFSRTAEERRRQDRNFLLSPTLEHDIVMALIVLPPGEGGDVAPATHPGQEVGFVQAGRLTLEIGGQRMVLDEGDSWFLKGSSPHRYINEGTEVVRLIVANTPAALLIRTTA